MGTAFHRTEESKQAYKRAWAAHKWTAQKKAELKELIAQGFTSNEIEEIFGYEFTRSAIVSKANRLRLIFARSNKVPKALRPKRAKERTLEYKVEAPQRAPKVMQAIFWNGASCDDPKCYYRALPFTSKCYVHSGAERHAH